MFKLNSFFSFLVALLFLVSCSNNSKTADKTETTTGNTGELVIFTTQNTGKEIKKIIDSLFAKDVKTVFPLEPFYHIIYADSKESADAFAQKHRNVLIIGLNSEIEELEIISGVLLDNVPEGKLFKALSGSDRSIHIAISATKQQLLHQLREQGERWSDAIYGSELSTDLPQPFTNETGLDSINNVFQSRYGFSMPMPSVFETKKITDDFAWLFYGGASLSLNIQVNIYPYNDSWLSASNIIQKRNDFGKRYILGEKSGTWMSTSESGQYVKEYWSLSSSDGQLSAGLNGAWVLLGETMGGPFCRKVILDKLHNRIIAVEGFTSSAPGRRIANLRLLESIIHGFHL